MCIWHSSIILKDFSYSKFHDFSVFTLSKVLQGNQQFYNVESGDYLDIHQLKETITSDNLPFSIQQFAIVDLTQNGI